MLRRLLLIAGIALPVSAISSTAHAASNGLVLGIEGGYGSFGLDGSKIVSKDPNGAYEPGLGPLFVTPLNEKSNYTLNLHLGWNVLGHASIEAAIHATSWDLFSKDRGGSGFVGGRVTWWPMQLFMKKDRPYDGGIELGTGYAIAGGPAVPGADPLGMSGSYFQFGLTGEYRISPFVGFAANFRYFKPFWNHFYIDYDNNLGATTTTPGGGWTTFTVGINLHLPAGADAETKASK